MQTFQVRIELTDADEIATTLRKLANILNDGWSDALPARLIGDDQHTVGRAWIGPDLLEALILSGNRDHPCNPSKVIDIADGIEAAEGVTP